MSDLIGSVRLYFGQREILGCTELKSSVSQKSQAVYEYLSSQPYAYAFVEEERLFTLKLRGNYEDFSDAELSPFRIVGSGFSVVYGVCSLISEREFSENGVLYREIQLGCSQRSLENE